MSVLIKGMKMPTSCSECALNYDCFKCIVTGTPFFDHEQNFDDETTCLDNCPLVEIPPHGRLIDADALRLLYDFSGYKPTGDMTEEEFDRLMYRLPVIRAIIDEAPTIIEAEENE